MDGIWMQISFNLDTERFKLLRCRAEQHSLGVGEFVTEIVREFLDKNTPEMPAEILKKVK